MNETETVNDALPIQLLPVNSVIKKYDSSVGDLKQVKLGPGLSMEEAKKRLITNGRNELTPPKERSEIVKFILVFLDPLNILLIIAGLLSAAVAYPTDKDNTVNLWIGVVLWAVVLLSGIFTYIQEGKASAVMKSFKNMLPRAAHVIRDGRLQDIPAAELVIGDLVYISTGDQVPADIRILFTSECKVELSSLTGESAPVTLALVTKEAKMEQAKNVAFNTSKVVEGEAIGVVFATGKSCLSFVNVCFTLFIVFELIYALRLLCLIISFVFYYV